MPEGQGKSVLIVDDNRDFAEAIKLLLEKEAYNVGLASSVEESLTLLEHSNSPRFIIADRILEGGRPIELLELERLSEAAGDSYIVVYTTVSDLTDEQIYGILSKGAIRVMNRDEVERFVADIKSLTREFDELIEISEELRTLTSERGKLVAALVGSEVGVTVIDRSFYCWYANDAQERIVGQPCSGNLCWKLFHRHSVLSGPCWGCTVEEVLRFGRPVERLFLLRFADGNVKWVSVRSTPILDSETGDVIAVREGVTEAKYTIVRGLGLEQRLQKIAQGLIYIGFGRTRIYRALADGHVELCAAAARFDDPREADSEYRQDLAELTFRYEDCPYARNAVNSNYGVFVSEWDSELGRSPFAEMLELEPPYFTIPVFYGDGRLCGFLCVDFVGVHGDVREDVLAQYAKAETLEWLSRDYAREIREAFEAAGHDPVQRGLYEKVQRAEIGIGAARSVNDAIQEIGNAFRSLVPECRVSVRILTDEGLREYEELCFGEREKDLPEVVELEDARSLEAQAIKLGRPIWVDDYQEYRSKATEEALPLGYSGPEVESCAHIPLMFERTVFGSLSIDSRESIDWREDGYMQPLQELSNLVALVVRDVALHEEIQQRNADLAAMTALYREIEQKSADLAAMTAYSITVSGDVIWRHWASQRLAEASLAVYECELILEQDGDKNELRRILQSLERNIEVLKEGRPPGQAADVCSLGNVLSALCESFTEGAVELICELPKLVPNVKVPRFHVRHILQILIDNAVEAIRSSGMGAVVRITVRKVERQLVEIKVCDDGPGIPEHLKEKLLREPMGSEDRHGTGLLIARGTALQYGGDLVRRETNTGACFVLTLPAA